jgi:hypothetical protein
MRIITFNKGGSDGDIIENNVQLPPQFADASEGNFAVESSSGAIGKGYQLDADYAKAIAPGMTRFNWPGSVAIIKQIVPWDIGAFKYIDDLDLISPASPKNVRIEQ